MAEDIAVKEDEQEGVNSLLTAEDEQQAEEQKTVENTASETQENGDKKEDTVPEAYEFQLQEGFSFDGEQKEEVTALFRELKLTNEQGQKLADYYMKQVGGVHAKTIADYQKAQAAEVEAAKNDAEIGGTALRENLGFAKAAMDKFGGEKFRSELDAHGMGNNPEMIRLLARVGRAMGGDTLVVGSSGGQAKDPAKVLYPHLA